MGAKFSHALWKKRAWKRHCDAVKAGAPEGIVGLKWVEELRLIEGMKKVVDWAKKKGYNVIFCKRTAGVILEHKKEIRISGRCSIPRQLHILLHECGHYLVGTKEKYERFGMGYGSNDPNTKRTYHHRIDILDEEMEAWHRGWKLALRLGALNVSDRALFDKTRIEFLRSYVQWAAKAPGFERYDDPARGND